MKFSPDTWNRLIILLWTDGQQLSGGREAASGYREDISQESQDLIFDAEATSFLLQERIA